MSINRIHKRLQGYFVTMNQEIDIPENRRECQRLVDTLAYDKRYRASY